MRFSTAFVIFSIRDVNACAGTGDLGTSTSTLRQGDLTLFILSESCPHSLAWIFKTASGMGVSVRSEGGSEAAGVDDLISGDDEWGGGRLDDGIGAGIGGVGLLLLGGREIARGGTSSSELERSMMSGELELVFPLAFFGLSMREALGPGSSGSSGKSPCDRQESLACFLTIFVFVSCVILLPLGLPVSAPVPSLSLLIAPPDLFVFLGAEDVIGGVNSPLNVDCSCRRGSFSFTHFFDDVVADANADADGPACALLFLRRVAGGVANEFRNDARGRCRVLLGLAEEDVSIHLSGSGR